MKLLILDSVATVAEWSALYVMKKIKNFSPGPKRYFVLGLPTGGTPLGMYQKLVEFHKAGKISFKYVKTFNMDEYVGLPRDHPESYRHYMYHNFFKHIDIDPENAHVLDGNAKNLQEECENFEKEIVEAGGVHLFIGGIGPDGHIAFNEPGSSLVTRTRVKTLAYETLEANARFFGNDLSKVPKQALTVGVGTVMDAQEVMILVTGSHKAFALHKAIEEGINHMWTVSAFQQHPSTIIVCDEDATLELKVKTVKYFKGWEDSRLSYDMTDVFIKRAVKTNFDHVVIENINMRTIDSIKYNCSRVIQVEFNGIDRSTLENANLSVLAKVFPRNKKPIDFLRFRKELGMYSKLIPLYNRICPANNLFTRSFDQHAVNPEFANERQLLLMENEIDNNYEVFQPQRLDERHTLAVLSKLALFHAIGAAVLDEDPQAADILQPALKGLGENTKNEDVFSYELQDEMGLILGSPDFEEYYPKILSVLKSIDKNRVPEVRDSFNSIVHNDMWISNILFEKGDPDNLKFIDFQTIVKNSPARDLSFLLFTSIERSVLAKYKRLIEYYHEHLNSNLQLLRKPHLYYKLGDLFNDLRVYGPNKLKHILWIEKTVHHIDNYEGYCNAVKYIVKEFANIGWI